MDIIQVAFDSPEKQIVVGCFSTPQPQDQYPYQEAVPVDDERLLAFYAAVPESQKGIVPIPTE